jgi:hypothetical protein
MSQLTYRQTGTNVFRVSADGVEIGSISLQTRHVHSIRTYWHWGIDTMPLIAGRTPDGDTDSFEAALKAFKAAFTAWLEKVPPDKWRENLEHKRASAERWK